MSLLSRCKAPQYINIPNIVAHHKVKMYMGGGIEFRHKNKEINEFIRKFMKNNNFYNFMYSCMLDVSRNGGTIIGVEPTEGDIPVVVKADPFFANALEGSYATNDMVVIRTKLKIDNFMVILETCYDKETIRRRIHSGDNEKDKLRLYNYVSKLPEEKRVKYGEWDHKNACYVYKHNLGMLPFVVIPNVPFVQQWPMFNAVSNFKIGYGLTNNDFIHSFSSLADTANCEGLCRQLQTVFNQTNKVSTIDQPRIVISNASQYLQNQAAKNNITKKIMDDPVFFTANAPINAQTRIATLPMTNSLEQYDRFIQSLYVQIFRHAGIDWVIQSGTNKTSSENDLTFYNTISTIQEMKNTITPYWKQIFIIACKIKGWDIEKELNKWIFVVRDNLPTDRSSLRQNLSIDLQNGAIDIADYKQEIDKCNRDEAEFKIERAKEFNKKMGFDPQQQNVSGVSYAKSGVGSANSKNAGRMPDTQKK